MKKYLLVLLIVSTFLLKCGNKEKNVPLSKKGADQFAVVFPVETTPVQTQLVAFSINAVGSIEAFEVVQVTARVPGVVDRILFSEGKWVKANQVLVEIEPERYRLAVEAAEAALAKAEATRNDTRAGLSRREGVIQANPGLIPAEELATWRTRLQVAESDVSQAKVALNQARLNLHDALVLAPVAGIIQTRSVQTGQYVQAGTVMATLIRRDPLLLRFKVSEQDAVHLRPSLKATFRVRNDRQTYTSQIIHVAASADETSRMVAITAEINDSRKNTLQPGSFAEISIQVGSSKLTSVIPQTAIRPSERGFISYVVENGKAVERILTLGMRTVDGQVQVLSGLTPKEMLVTRGAEALRPGAAVRVTNLETNPVKAVKEEQSPIASGVPK